MDLSWDGEAGRGKLQAEALVEVCDAVDDRLDSFLAGDCAKHDESTESESQVFRELVSATMLHASSCSSLEAVRGLK